MVRSFEIASSTAVTPVLPKTGFDGSLMGAPREITRDSEIRHRQGWFGLSRSKRTAQHGFASKASFVVVGDASHKAQIVRYVGCLLSTALKY